MPASRRGTSDPFAPDDRKSARKKTPASTRKPKEAPAPAAFKGFPDGSFAFFRELDAEQDRDWFLANKARYDAQWYEPMRAFMHAVQKKLAGTFPKSASSEVKVFRIQRDLRFTLDRTPYKTSISAMLPLSGAAKRDEMNTTDALYIQLGLEPIIAVGRWMMPADALDAYRRAVADEKTGPALTKILERLTREGVRVSSHETLKRVPPGFDTDHPRADLLKRKGLALMFPTPSPAVLSSPDAVDWLVKQAKRAAPLLAWLTAATAKRTRSKR